MKLPMAYLCWIVLVSQHFFCLFSLHLWSSCQEMERWYLGKCSTSYVLLVLSFGCLVMQTNRKQSVILFTVLSTPMFASAYLYKYKAIETHSTDYHWNAYHSCGKSVYLEWWLTWKWIEVYNYIEVFIKAIYIIFVGYLHCFHLF